MKILIVAGFLGAGKTTFIKTMAQKAGRDFAVYENEYSGADIDALRLKQTDKLNVFESLENCICCSGGNDFANGVLTISSALNPEYLIVEPTGLAKPSNIISNISRILYGSMQLLSPVAIVDGPSYICGLNASPDIFFDQIKCAGNILISKTDCMIESEITFLKDTLLKINPSARIISDSWEKLPPSFFDEILSLNINGEIIPAPEKSAQTRPMDEFSLSGVFLSSPANLIAFLNNIVFGGCGRIYRAKGALPCAKEWVKFDLVSERWAIAPQGAQEKSQAVFIGNDIKRYKIRKALRADLYERKSRRI